MNASREKGSADAAERTAFEKNENRSFPLRQPSIGTQAESSAVMANRNGHGTHYVSERGTVIRYSATALFMPSSKEIVGFQPSFCILLESINLRNIPSGFEVSQPIVPRNPAASAIFSARLRIVMSDP